MDNNTRVFLALVKAGLWGDGNPDVRIDGTTVWREVYRLATEQSVLGLVLAGLERSDLKPPKVLLLQWIGEVQQIEQRNKAMNVFIADLIDRLRKEDIYCLLVKGQGVAQCYKRPLWRSSGDIDLLLNTDNYYKAKLYFDKYSDYYKDGSKKDMINLHREYSINDWQVELHGTLNSNLSRRIDRVIDSVKNKIFYEGEVRVWQHCNTSVYLPSPDNDIIFIFTHILQHFFNGGIGLRQICDWCRLLWTYRDTLNCNLLESRIKKMGLLSEWTAFASLAVVYMGMPVEAMPLYKKGCERKAERILSYIIKSGNFGHNRDFSYTKRHSTLVRKAITLWRQAKDSCQLALIFPIDAPKFLVRYIYDGINSLLHKKSIINL